MVSSASMPACSSRPPSISASKSAQNKQGHAQDPEPQQEHNGLATGAVGFVVMGKIGHVKSQTGGEHHKHNETDDGAMLTQPNLGCCTFGMACIYPKSTLLATRQSRISSRAFSMTPVPQGFFFG